MTSLEQLQERLDALTTQVQALDVDAFYQADRIRRGFNLAERTATGLDDLEETLTEGLELLDNQTSILDHLVRRDQATNRRLGAVEADLFTLTERVRLAAKAADRAAVGLDELEAILDEVDERAGETAVAMELAMRQRQAALDADPNGTGSTEAADTVGRRPTLDVLHAWVGEHIGPLVRKITATGEGGGIRWCRQWWRHHDAVDRFTALYLVFTELSDQPTLSWLSAYLRDHLDPHLSVLTSPFGPFYACTPLRHSDSSNPLSHTKLTEPDPTEPSLVIANGSVTALGNGTGGTT
jgi:hypothetical protein